jgi:hypothetical protein
MKLSNLRTAPHLRLPAYPMASSQTQVSSTNIFMRFWQIESNLHGSMLIMPRTARRWLRGELKCDAFRPSPSGSTSRFQSSVK